MYISQHYDNNLIKPFKGLTLICHENKMLLNFSLLPLSSDLYGSSAGLYCNQANWRWRRQLDGSGTPVPSQIVGRDFYIP